MCQMAGVSRSGYYSWRSKGSENTRIADCEARDLQDFKLILTAYKFRGYDKGVKGIYMRFLHLGIRMNHKKIRRLMRKYNLFCPIRKRNPYRQMAKMLQTNKIADNFLRRRFRQLGPRRVFLTDITFIRFKGRFVYLSVIIDAYTKQVMAYVLSKSLEVDFVLETLRHMIREHRASIEADALIHSDQGCHYTSIPFRELLNNHQLRQSMSRRGNCWDNAPQESFFGHMKDELELRSAKWNSYKDLQSSIDDWMDYYNNDRYQADLENLSPNEYYNYIKTGEYPSGMVSKNDIVSLT